VEYFNNRSIKIYSTNTQLIMYENCIIYKFIKLKKYNSNIFQTHNRMKLIQKQERREEKRKSSLPRKRRESTPDKSENPTETEQPPPPPVVPPDS
jgi:hypothetical protein